MAELLIGMTIIGILAAIILPSLNANLNEKLWKTQRKALYTILSQAITQLPAMGGYGDYDTTNGVDNSAEVFITKGLATHLKINQICAVDYGASDQEAREALKQCGISEEYIDTEGNKRTFPVKYSTARTQPTPAGLASHVAAFQTANGDNVAVFYNPFAGNDYHYGIGTRYPIQNDVISAIFIYDLNGLDKPNQFGKDKGAFVTVFGSDPDFIVVDPVYNSFIVNHYVNYNSAINNCRARDKTSHLVSLNEFMAILATQNFFRNSNNKITSQQNYWTRTSWFEDKSKIISIFYNGTVHMVPTTGTDSKVPGCNRSLFKKK